MIVKGSDVRMWQVVTLWGAVMGNIYINVSRRVTGYGFYIIIIRKGA